MSMVIYFRSQIYKKSCFFSYSKRFELQRVIDTRNLKIKKINFIMRVCLLFFPLFFLNLITFCNGDRYRVVMMPLAMRSQVIIYARLAEELAQHNFDITLFIPDCMESPTSKHQQHIHIKKYHLRKVPMTEDPSEDGFPYYYNM